MHQLPSTLDLARRGYARRTALGSWTVVAALAVMCVAGIDTRTARAQTVATDVRGATAETAATRAEQPIVPGDRIIMRVWREPTWSDAYGVDVDGNVELPRIGRLRVTQLTPRALGDTIRTRLAAYLRDPNVDVVVQRRVAVLGAVLKPNVLYIDAVSTLSDVIAQAGGIAEEGDPNRIAIVRGGQRVRVGEWRDAAASSLPVQSGDQIIVGRRNWFARNGVAAISSLAVAVSVLVTAFR